MDTGYHNKVKFEITGDISEDVGSNHTEIIKAELRLICAKYGLGFTEVYPYEE